MTRSKRRPSVVAPQGRFLHVRSSEELDTLLDRELTHLHKSGTPPNLVNRSVLVRSLLFAVLGSGTDGSREGTVSVEQLTAGLTRAAAREVLQQVVLALETASNRALAEMVTKLPGLLEQELGLEGQPGLAAG